MPWVRRSERQRKVFPAARIRAWAPKHGLIRSNCRAETALEAVLNKLRESAPTHLESRVHCVNPESEFGTNVSP